MFLNGLYNFQLLSPYSSNGSWVMIFLSTNISKALAFPGVIWSFLPLVWFVGVVVAVYCCQNLWTNSNYSMAPSLEWLGYLIQAWAHLQKQWEYLTHTSLKYCCGKEVIVILHTYAYDTWKVWNDIVHGKTEKSNKAIHRAKLQERVAKLYTKGRANLSLKEK